MEGQGEARCICEHVSEPWFSLIKLGIKTCEGRLNKGTFASLSPGDIIQFENSDFGFNRLAAVRVVESVAYASFAEYLAAEGLARCLPGVDTIDEGRRVYYKYYTAEDEEKSGVLAIQIAVL